MKHTILIAAVLVSGCTTTRGVEHVATNTVIQKQNVIVRVPCVDKADIPPEPAKIGSTLNGMAGHDLTRVSASAFELRIWGQRLNALLLGCIKQ